MNNDIFNGVGIEIELTDSENFLKIKETLTRIGLSSHKDNTIFQSCHILHKKGRYVIIHFKELFRLDGKKTEISETDIIRRDSIAMLLEQWGLLKLKETTCVDLPDLKYVKVIPFNKKHEWNLKTKYTIGKKFQ